MSTFVGKVAIVTGGGSGIGEAAAKLLAGSGADVLVADFDEHNGERVVGEILKASGGQAAYLHTDVSKESDAERLVQFAVDRFGGLHAALNNAGIAQPFGRTHEQDLSVLQRVLTVNVQGTFRSLRAELRYFVEHGGGAIVNTASIAGLRAVAGMPAYAASNYAIVGMTRLAAIEYVHEIDPLEPESVDQRGGVSRHSRDGVRRFACAEPDAGVVCEDHVAARGEDIGDRRVVGVEIPHEVLQQHDRRAGRVPEAPVGEADPVELGEPCRRGFVAVPAVVDSR